MGVSKSAGRFGGFSMKDLQSSCPKINIEVSNTDEIIGRDPTTNVIVLRSSRSFISGKVIQAFINSYKHAEDNGLL